MVKRTKQRNRKKKRALYKRSSTKDRTMSDSVRLAGVRRTTVEIQVKNAPRDTSE